jgi:hypothetical protein
MVLEVLPMNRWRILGLVALLSGCGAPAAGATSSGGPVPSTERVLLGTYGGIVVVDPTTGRIETSVPAGLPSPDFNRFYRVTDSPAGTRLEVLDRDGSPLRQLSIDGHYQRAGLRAGDAPWPLSPNGRWLALEGQSDRARTETAFAVVDTSFAEPVRQFSVPGRIALDGISDDRVAYLLEYTRTSPEGYRLRSYQVGANILDQKVLVEKGTDKPVMSGHRVVAVTSSDGEWLFGLYVGQKAPFVHALNLKKKFAMCVDLPATGSGWGDWPSWSLTLSRDGRSLFAANSTTGYVGAIRTDVPELLRSTTVSLDSGRSPAEWLLDHLLIAARAKDMAPGAKAAAASDGRTLYLPTETGVLAFDTRHMRQRETLLAATPVISVGLSPDGSRLYAADRRHENLAVLTLSTGARRVVPIAADITSVIAVRG